MLEARTDTVNEELNIPQVMNGELPDSNEIMDVPDKPAKPTRGRKPKAEQKANGSKPRNNSTIFLVLLPPDADGKGQYRQFNEDDMLSEAAEAFGKPDLRITKSEVLNFEIVQK